jgi:hypothetical protein
MGYTNSDLMEEIMVICYQEGIIEKVREEVRNILQFNTRISLPEAYEMAYQKISKKN